MGQEGQFVLLQLRKIFPRLRRGAGAQALVVLASSRQGWWAQARAGHGGQEIRGSLSDDGEVENGQTLY